MNDRELLELAAKAAGILLVWDGDSPKEVTEHWSCDPTEPPHEREWDWNPVSDDGDALRLAVKLRLTPMMRGLGCDTTDSNGGASAYEKWGAHPFAAARRSIVRAAAEIGRQMQEGGAS